MVAAVFVRTLKPGVSFEDFELAWGAEKGYGVPARVFNAVNLENPREVLSIGFVAVPAEAMAAMSAGLADDDSDRHDRVDEVVESTTLRAMFEVSSEHDFSGDPRSIELGSGESLLATLPEVDPTR